MRPILFELLHQPIYSYPLFLGLSFGSAYYYALSVLEKKYQSLISFRILFIGIFLFAWLGAKVFFLIHTSHSAINDFASSNFWLGGGFVFYGGLIFATLFALLYCLVLKKFSFKDLLLCMPALPLAHAIGRIGCFLAGCCFGAESTFWWMNKHPVQLYEAFGNFCIFLFLKWLIRKNRVIEIPYAYFVSYSILRFLLEFYRADQIRGVYFGLSSAQFTSIFILMVLGSIKYKLSKKN